MAAIELGDAIINDLDNDTTYGIIHGSRRRCPIG
jgi:hypothetical protein